MNASLLHVAIGGAAGSTLRYLTLTAITAPSGTLVVNVVGSFAIGVLYVTLSPRLHPLFLTGLLGGFTTFSAFSLDALKLWQSGQTTQAALYTAASVTLSFAAVTLGAALAQKVLT